MNTDPLERINKNLESWIGALQDPLKIQKGLLHELLKLYDRTSYGQIHGAGEVTCLEDYRDHFPAVSYDDLTPWIDRVRSGDTAAFLSEEPVTWVTTRGTSGKPKVLPVTPRHLEDIFLCGSRAVLNYCMGNGKFDPLIGGVLNLQFPSNMYKMRVGGREVNYGFSSGTYARLNPMMMGLRLVPRQESIDALETGLSKSEWDRRYEFIYRESQGKNVVTVMGVAPVQTGFARYLKRRHDVYPRDLWDIKVVFTTSVAKIHTKYRGIIEKMYGDVPVIEMYTATEGAFGQQIDEFPYWVPNYDRYLFEVRTRGGYKMLYEIGRGEWGRLVISTSMLPRYEIGDLVEGMGRYYYRVFGRDKPTVLLEHMLYRALFRWFL